MSSTKCPPCCWGLLRGSRGSCLPWGTLVIILSWWELTHLPLQQILKQITATYPCSLFKCCNMGQDLMNNFCPTRPVLALRCCCCQRLFVCLSMCISSKFITHSIQDHQIWITGTKPPWLSSYIWEVVHVFKTLQFLYIYGWYHTWPLWTSKGKINKSMHKLSSVDSSPPSAAFMHQCIGSALVQVMACHLCGAKPIS